MTFCGRDSYNYLAPNCTGLVGFSPGCCFGAWLQQSSEALATDCWIKDEILSSRVLTHKEYAVQKEKKRKETLDCHDMAPLLLCSFFAIMVVGMTDSSLTYIICCFQSRRRTMKKDDILSIDS